ncbi:hypothetical protein R1flu_027473 [Riccia fluitans]|uniref:Uncharacterized protein n=1 Tax=Riccia fluitans TaxID=41844 RepID=A0ABD1XIW8_9MARC
MVYALSGIKGLTIGAIVDISGCIVEAFKRGDLIDHSIMVSGLSFEGGGSDGPSFNCVKLKGGGIIGPSCNCADLINVAIAISGSDGPSCNHAKFKSVGIIGPSFNCVELINVAKAVDQIHTV